MTAIELLPVVLASMVLGGSLGWFWFHSFFNGAAIGFLASFVLLGIVAFGAATMTRLNK
jgi:hypothetical protein